MSLAQLPGSLFLRRRLIIVLSILVLVIVAVWFFSRPKPVLVVLTTVGRGTVEATVSNTRAGTVKACRRSQMAPPAGGQISQMLVKKGQRVKAGQVLLRLWSEDLQAQDRLAHEQLKTAQTQMQQACVQADLAEKEAERAHQLQAQGFISPQGLDQRDSEAKVARAGCEAAHSEVEQARSRIEVAKAALDRMTLRAPFAGVIADISGEQGEFATPSPPGIPTPPAIDLIDDSCLYVSAPIDEVDASHVKEGLPGRMTLDAIKGQQFEGKVRRVAPYVLDLEKQARTVEVEMEFLHVPPRDGGVEPSGAGGAAGKLLPQAADSASAEGSPRSGGAPTGLPLAGSNVSQLPKSERLLVGYSADVEIIYDTHKHVLRIPTSALMEGKHVMLYRDGVLENRVVETGLSNWEYTEITSGLNEGDQIVLSLDRDGVKDGARAKPDTSAPSK
jgi:HlyD family secretion protein